MAQIPYMNWMGDQPSGSAYDVYQYYLGGGSPGSTQGGGGGGISSLPWYQQTGGGNGGGSNAYGYDPNVSKQFNVQQWARTGDPVHDFDPGEHGWVDNTVTGYKSPSGWKTKEGKNIEHGGLFKTDLNRKTGDIKGIPFKEAWEDEKEKLAALRAKIFGSKKSEAKKAQAEKIANERIAKERIAAAEKDQKVTPPRFPPSTWTPAGDNGGGQTPGQRATEAAQRDDPGWGGHKKGGRIGLKKGSTRDRLQKDWKSYSKLIDLLYAAPPILQDKPGSYLPDRDAEQTRLKERFMYGDQGKAQGGMVKDLTKDPEYRGWKKMYETNPEIGSMHEKHPTFIKFYKKHERDRKKFGGLAGLLYG